MQKSLAEGEKTNNEQKLRRHKSNKLLKGQGQLRECEKKAEKTWWEETTKTPAHNGETEEKKRRTSTDTPGHSTTRGHGARRRDGHAEVTTRTSLSLQRSL